MRAIFLRRFVDTLHPAPRQHRPQKHRAGYDQHAKPPASVRRVQIDLSRAHQHKGDGEKQSCGEISAKQAESDDGDIHGNESSEG